MRIVLLACLAASAIPAAERQVDPSFLRRYIPDVKAQASELTTATCRYKAAFGAGDDWARLLRGVARYGEITVDAGGACAALAREREETAFVVLEGGGVLVYGGKRVPVKTNDFFYVAPGVRHALEASSGGLRAIVMGFRIPAGVAAAAPPELPLANLDEVKKQTVGGHPPSTLYQLMMGDVSSKRDRLATGRVLTSLYVMEFTAGGTNFPHHHETEEEIYLVLNGTGQMVAGSGMDGVEARFPAKPGDAYFFRLNCTVGFYAGEGGGRVLAVRSLFPFPFRK